MQMKKLCAGLAVTLLLASGLLANGLNLNGVGTRAISMGGAFIGLADDWSAIFWNPAGLTQIKKPVFFLSGSLLIPQGTYSFPLAAVDAKTAAQYYPAGMVGYLHPIGDSIVVGIGAYTPSGVGAEWNGAELQNLTKGVPYDWESMIGIFSLSPVIAVKLGDYVSLGATFNVDYGFMNIKRPLLGQYTEKIHGWTFGATFGLLVKPSDRISFGATLRTPSNVTFKGAAQMPAAAGLGLAPDSDISRTATWPLWIGAGIAVKPLTNLTITADGQYTNWKKLQTIPAVYSDPIWQASFSNASTFELLWKDRIQWRFGLEYAFTSAWAVRAGYYFDKSPSPPETLNILLPEISYNAAALGFGYKSGSFTFDVGMEFLFGQKVVSPLATGVMPGTHGMNIYAPTIAFAYHF